MGNLISIIVLVVLVLFIWFAFTSRKPQPEGAVPPQPLGEQAAPIPPPPSVETSPAAPRATPRESTREELMNTTEEPLTPEYVKKHVAKLKHSLEMGVKGARMSIPFEKDPRKLQEMQQRVEMAERLIKKLNTVDPENRSTWFFVDTKKGSPEAFGFKPEPTQPTR